MLVLTRRKGESLIINGNIKVQIINTKNDTVRIGIDAPKEVSVHREEIHNRIQQQREDLES